MKLAWLLAIVCCTYVQASAKTFISSDSQLISELKTGNENDDVNHILDNRFDEKARKHREILEYLPGQNKLVSTLTTNNIASNPNGMIKMVVGNREKRQGTLNYLTGRSVLDILLRGDSIKYAHNAASTVNSNCCSVVEMVGAIRRKRQGLYDYITGLASNVPSMVGISTGYSQYISLTNRALDLITDIIKVGMAFVNRLNSNDQSDLLVTFKPILPLGLSILASTIQEIGIFLLVKWNMMYSPAIKPAVHTRQPPTLPSTPMHSKGTTANTEPPTVRSNPTRRSLLDWVFS